MDVNKDLLGKDLKRHYTGGAGSTVYHEADGKCPLCFRDPQPDKPSLTETDNDVDHPAHYTAGKIEVLDFLEDQKHLDFRGCNVIKYVVRAKLKGKALSDYKKARFYLNRLIVELEKADG